MGSRFPSLNVSVKLLLHKCSCFWYLCIIMFRPNFILFYLFLGVTKYWKYADKYYFKFILLELCNWSGEKFHCGIKPTYYPQLRMHHTAPSYLICDSSCVIKIINLFIGIVNFVGQIIITHTTGYWCSNVR